MLEKILIQQIQNKEFKNRNIEASILRLDQIHPVVSGNKLFKLNCYLKDATEKNKKGIITFGGAFSNHLVATAFAAKDKGLHAIGCVRREAHEAITPTLQECISYGMELKYIPRQEFDNITLDALDKRYTEYAFIPHGGYGIQGARGAEDILHNNQTKEFTHIIAACGTGTMGAGLINSAGPNQEIILISVLKNNFSIHQEVGVLLTDEGKKKKYQILFQYHMGGYAKKNSDVFTSMNQFFTHQNIPTDFVYTGKMIHAFFDLVQHDFFKEGSKILLIHSGGLQGNRSLTNNELIF